MRSSIEPTAGNVPRERGVPRLPEPRIRRLRRSLSRAAACLGVLGLAACAGQPGPTARADGQVGVDLAQAALHSGSPAASLRLADQTLAAHPDAPAALMTRAEALTALGQLAAARSDFEHVLRLHPRTAPALVGLGRVSLASDPAAAETAFRSALKLTPRNAIALNDLGIALDLEGRHAAAEQTYRQALALQPGMTSAEVNLALSLAMQGRGSDAIRLLRPLATTPKAGPKLREDYAAVLAMAGQRDRARQILSTDLPAPQASAAMNAFEMAAAGHVPAPTSGPVPLAAKPE